MTQKEILSLAERGAIAKWTAALKKRHEALIEGNNHEFYTWDAIAERAHEQLDEIRKLIGQN